MLEKYRTAGSIVEKNGKRDVTEVYLQKVREEFILKPGNSQM